MKKCFRCKDLKPFSEFYKHPGMADGFLGKCKTCTKLDTSTNRKENPIKISEYERTRNKTLERKKSVKEYRSRYKTKNNNKIQARSAVGHAIRDKRLNKEPCIYCGSFDNIEAHHKDYDKPLDVIWCCFKCHREKEHNQTVIIK